MSTNVRYTLVFKNDSTNPGTVMLFQKDPGLGNDVMPLAWFTHFTHPTTAGLYQWQTNYSFVWSQTGELVPGVDFVASQDWSADLETMNQVTFSLQGGAYTFMDQQTGPLKGSLYIKEDGTIPLKAASVGIGMSGAGTFAVQAQPNLNLKFTPHPEYWIAFGNYRKGEVLDIQEITNSAKIEFEPSIYSMSATLNRQNEWIIKPTFVANADIAESRKRSASSLRRATA